MEPAVNIVDEKKYEEFLLTFLILYVLFWEYSSCALPKT